MRVLIATLYSFDPVMLAITKLSIDRAILIVDKAPNEQQKKAVDLVNNSLKKSIEITYVKADVYDIVSVAEKLVNVIDGISDKDEIYVNITASRKTQALGLLFAAYARFRRIKHIIYITEENKKIIYLPKLSYNLNNSQIKVLEYIRDNNIKSPKELAGKVELSTGMLYRVVTELQNIGLIIDNEGLKLTDAGRIAIL